MRNLIVAVCVVVGFTGAADARNDESTQTQRQYLSGTGPNDTVEWQFKCTAGRRSGGWDVIPVPSNWECQGFGTFNYGHDKKKSDEKGFYKLPFTVPATWKTRRIIIVFEGVMTDTEVKINGRSAGPVHQGGFYRFTYDVTKLIKSGGKNLLEVTVNKVSANRMVELAERKGDYWVFGGIYRPVYLEAFPEEYVEWTSVDAKADGTFRLDVYLKNVKGADRVVARILDSKGRQVGSTSSDIPDGDK